MLPHPVPLYYRFASLILWLLYAYEKKNSDLPENLAKEESNMCFKASNLRRAAVITTLSSQQKEGGDSHRRHLKALCEAATSPVTE